VKLVAPLTRRQIVTATNFTKFESLTLSEYDTDFSVTGVCGELLILAENTPVAQSCESFICG